LDHLKTSKKGVVIVANILLTVIPGHRESLGVECDADRNTSSSDPIGEIQTTKSQGGKKGSAAGIPDSFSHSDHSGME
jgi:hypothetical protein